MNSTYSTEHVDYLQRIGLRPAPVTAETPMTRALPNMRHVFQVREIGVFEKPTRDLLHREGKPQLHLPTEELIASLYGYEICLAFLFSSTRGGVSVGVGTWSPGTDARSREALDIYREVLETALQSLYPAIRYEYEANAAPVLPFGGLALGIPTVKPFDEVDGLFPVDRLLRAMGRSSWSYFVLAQPVTGERTRRLRDAVINETRQVKSAVEAEHTPSPLAEYYLELLKASLTSLSAAVASGCWRTAIYLLGDKESYPKLASMWRGLFSGDDSLPEPVHIWDNLAVPKLAAEWAMPDLPSAPGPGLIRHLVESQTILSSTQLSAYVHFPKFESSGFSVKLIPDFDLVPARASAGSTIVLGKVLPQSQLLPRSGRKDGDRSESVRQWYETALSETYDVGSDALTKHIFVAGVTGAGKTRTIFTILKSAFTTETPVPFLVIEPAKTEYRELLNHSEVGGNLQVFTPGNENASPFRLNPFEVPEGTPIGVHIDLLRSIFSASFGWWNPLPQVFEKCASLIYRDRGWDLASDFNYRTNSREKIDPYVFPTLSDLLEKADEVIPTLGYDPEAQGRVQGHFRATLLGLGTGAKGRMFDVQRSLPMSVLLDNPTVLELEGLGDDDDKAFVMGLLLIRLVEHRRSPEDRERGATNKGLRHLLVIEEAHRLLTNVALKSQEGAANPREKAVETFTNLLAEIRKYGQGVVVADQVPTKLAPDVIKNTNLKIAHRIVDEPDRKVLAGSMVMTEKQALALATLLPGQAAVFAEGDDAPLLVQIAPGVEQPAPTEQSVRKVMSTSSVLAPYRDIFLRHSGCADTADGGGSACEAAKALVATSTFQRDFNRLVLSVLADDSAGDRLWPPIAGSMNLFGTDRVDREIMLKCVIARAADQYASRRGFQSQWSFDDTGKLALSLAALVSCIATNAPLQVSAERFRELVYRLSAMKAPPYSMCRKICDGDPPRCLYRNAVADTVDRGIFKDLWDAGGPFNRERAEAQWETCRRIANMLVEQDYRQADPFRRIGLCYQQMMLSRYGGDLVPEAKDQLVEALFVPAGGQG